MIIIQLFGGLGNQMFQYAAGRSLALMNNTQCKLDLSKLHKTKKKNTPRQYGLSHFNILDNFVSDNDLANTKTPLSYGKNIALDLKGLLTRKKVRVYKIEPHFNFFSEFFSLPDDIYLIGFWQSEKYFKKYADIIKQEFTLRRRPDIRNLQMGQALSRSNAISIHFRRGDYVTNPHAYKHHGVCSLVYYHSAIQYIIEKISDPHFYIFSDDPE